MKIALPIILAVAVATFVGFWISSRRHAADWIRTVSLFATEMAVVRDETPTLKGDVSQYISTTNDMITSAQQEAERWSETSANEQNEGMKSVDEAFRNADNTHGSRLRDIENEGVTVGEIGETAETSFQALELIQPGFEGAAGLPGRPVPSQEYLGELKRELADQKASLQQLLVQLAQSKKRLADLLADCSKQNEGMQAALAMVAAPKDRMEEWQKELAKSDLGQIGEEKERLETAQALLLRLAKMVSELEVVAEGEAQVLQAYR